MNKITVLSGFIFLFAAAGIGFAASKPALAESSYSFMSADYVLVEKAKRRMTLYRRGQILRRYGISLGKGGLEPKVREGDGRTPEGVYQISGRNPESDYHLSLRISYPGPDDVRRAQMLGVSPGGDIMIHGLANEMDYNDLSRLPRDWTLGCIAVSNEEIKEIWRLVPDGTPIAIRP